MHSVLYHKTTLRATHSPQTGRRASRCIQVLLPSLRPPPQVFLIFQCVLLVFTALSAFVIKPGSAYETYDPEADQRNRDQLDAMANERGGQFGGSTFAANYGKIRGKMQKKYGEWGGRSVRALHTSRRGVGAKETDASSDLACFVRLPRLSFSQVAL